MKPYKLAARDASREATEIEVKGPLGLVIIGPRNFTLIAGPCAVEGRDQFLELALMLRDLGAVILRGGAYKPRTSPYSFAGLEAEGLAIIAEARALTGLPVVTEVVDVRQMDLVCQYADMIQIGSRNMQNFGLLKEAGRCGKPVLLKRGLAATVEEWLLAAEYILNAGNDKVVLCERGIRTFEPLTRNTADISAVALIRELSHLPVLVDPSHATGKRSLVRPVAKAAVAAGADGIMVEVHTNPDNALSDGAQSITPEQFAIIAEDVRRLAVLENRAV